MTDEVYRAKCDYELAIKHANDHQLSNPETPTKNCEVVREYQEKIVESYAVMVSAIAKG